MTMHWWQEWDEESSSWTTKSGRPSTRWRGRSVGRITENKQSISAAHAGIRALKKAISEWESENARIAADMLGNPDRAEYSLRPCPESPHGRCIYIGYAYEENVCEFCGTYEGFEQ